MIKFVYFDIGGVLVTDSFMKLVPSLAKEWDLSEEKVEVAYRATKTWKYGVGLVTEKRWKSFLEKVGKSDDFERFMEKWHSIFNLMPETVEIAKKVKVRKGILSDQPHDIMPKMRTMGFLELFEVVLISAEVSMSKSQPDTKFYQFAVEKASVLGEEILFIDNMQRNLDDAAKTGMKGLLFENAEKLEKDLQKLGLL